MIGRLNHVGVATPNLKEAVETYRKFFGARVISDVIELPERGVRVQFVDTPNSQVELLEPMGENSPIAAFLERNPKGGQHHLCFEVPDIHEARAEMETKGAQVVAGPYVGAHGTPVIFVHPKDFQGVLIELMETPHH